MKVSRTAAVLVGCSVLAATSTAADVPVGAAIAGTGGKPGKMKAASDMESTTVSAGKASNGNGHHRGKTKRAGNRALRGGHADAAEGGKAAKTHGGDRPKTNHRKKRSLKSSKSSSPGNGSTGNGGGNGGNNRAYTAYAANGQMVDNTPYVNNKYDYLDRYSAHLTPEQLQRLRTNNNTPPADQETNVGGAEDPAAVVSTASATAATSSYSASYTQTAAVQQSGPATTPYVSTFSREDGDSNDNERGYDATATGNADALNRGFEAEASIANYDPSTGYGSTGNNGGTTGDGNTNGNGGGALDTSTPARPIVQTTEWKPIDKSVWVQHYVPGVGSGPNNSNKNTAASSSTTTFPNRNPSLSTGGGSANSMTANRIPASAAPCNGANPSAAPSQGIQHVFESTLWGTCTTTENGCRPGSCCLYHPTFNRGACVAFAEICQPGERPGEKGDCPYPWMTSNLCRCAGAGAVLP